MSWDKTMKQTEAELLNVYGKPLEVRNEVVYQMTDAEFENTPFSGIYNSNDLAFKIRADKAYQLQWIKNRGLEVCKKKDATCCLTVGDKSQSGCFVLKHHKCYWLRPKQ